MSEIDILIKNFLNNNANENSNDVDSSLYSFKSRLNNSSRNYQKITAFDSLNARKSITLAASCLILILLLLGSSSTVRAMALDAINSVKMLFVTQKSGDTVEIVQKPSSEVNGLPYSYILTDKSDTEIGDLVEFPVCLPKKLGGSYELQARYIIIGLKKEIPYDSIKLMTRQLQAAIDNQDEFNRLSSYSPFRGVMCNYALKGSDEQNKVDFSITSGPLPVDLSNYSDKEEVIIGDTTGYWINVKYPEYPCAPAGEDPMTYKPTIRDDHQTLNWSKDGIYYSIQILHQASLDFITKDVAIGLAREFIAAQSK